MDWWIKERCGGGCTASQIFIISVLDNDWTGGAQTVTWLLTPVVAIGATTSHANQLTWRWKHSHLKCSFCHLLSGFRWLGELNDINSQYASFTSTVFSLVCIYNVCTVNSELHPQDYASGFVCFRLLTTSCIFQSILYFFFNFLPFRQPPVSAHHYT